MNSKISLLTAVEIWFRYGAYLTGVTAISREYPEKSFTQFLSACGHSRGGWAEQALRNAWNGGR